MEAPAAELLPPDEAPPSKPSGLSRLKNRLAAIRARSRPYESEAAWLTVVLAIALVVRLHQLGSLPGIVTADETDNLQVAYHIISGNGPGVFGFDWKPAPIFSLYPLAWCIQLFGDSIAAFRMFPVILSMLTLAAFYFVARQRMGATAALLALLLMATNLWVLHFSRTAWENMNSALFALGACYALTRAFDTRKTVWWVAVGVFVAFGFYGYFSGRFIFVSVGLATAVALGFRLTPWRPALRGLAIAATVSVVLFAPMGLKIIEEWDYFNQRTDAVSIFNGQPYEGETSQTAILFTNIERTVKGFLLLDNGEFGRGLWARYNPIGRGPFDTVSTLLFFAGFAVALWRWRRSYVWLTMLAPLFITQVFSRGTPDLARAIVAAPVYFLVIGLLFEEGLQRAPDFFSRRALLGVAGLVVVYAAMTNVGSYFDWQQEERVQSVRLPGVAACEFELWRGMAVDAAERGSGNLKAQEFDEARRELLCSPIVNVWLGIEPPPDSQVTEEADDLADLAPDDRRRRDLARLHDALSTYSRRNDGLPSTNGRIQSLCTFKELDAGCRIESVIKPIPRDPENEGYWYTSDGKTFTIYALMSEPDNAGCPADIPEFFRLPDRMLCLSGP